MQIVKDKQIIDNAWSYIVDDGDVMSGDICVSISRWKKDKQQLLNHHGKIGIRIGPEDSTEEIAEDLDKIQLVELDFPALADGRPFSHAWLLRGRHHFQGEIRATGHFLPDQVFYLSRVGVNAFDPEKQEDLPVILDCLNDFSTKYQPSIN
jgi:uncharacterized protein (DUF934 family)